MCFFYFFKFNSFIHTSLCTYVLLIAVRVLGINRDHIHFDLLTSVCIYDICEPRSSIQQDAELIDRECVT